MTPESLIKQILLDLQVERNHQLNKAQETANLDHNSFGSGFDQGVAEGLQIAIDIIQELSEDL